MVLNWSWYFTGIVVFDVEMTHQGIAHHKCVENEVGDLFPSRGGTYRTDLLVLAGLTALDYALAVPHLSPKWHRDTTKPP